MARLVAVLGVLAVLLVGVQPAWAAPPMDLTSQLTDEVGALADGRAAAQEAVDRLETENGITLHVVLVATLEAEPDTTWVEETARLSGFEGPDVLLAVASGQETYEYEWWIDEAYPGSATDVENLLISEVQPRLDAADWSGAVVTMADGLRSLGAAEEEVAEPPQWSATTIMLVIGAVVVVLVVAHLFSRRRSPADTSR